MSEHPVIAIIMATLLEAEPFIDGLALEKKGGKPCPVYEGKDLVLILSGMGKTNAAMATTFAGLELKPKIICNLGAAGAVKKTFSLGSIHQIRKVIEPDRPDLISGLPHVYNPQVFKGFNTAVLATHDRPVKTPEERQETAIYADLCDMEGAAAVQAAEKFGIPCLLFKFVSDTPNPHEQGDIVKTIKELRTPFCRFFLKSVLPKIK